MIPIGLKEVCDAGEFTKLKKEDIEFSSEALEKYNKMSGLPENCSCGDESDKTGISPEQRHTIKIETGWSDVTIDSLDSFGHYRELREQGYVEVYKEGSYQLEIPQKEYRDDNGIVYRQGDKLLPNTEYNLNGYQYRTDSEGRLISAEGNLHLKDREGRLPLNESMDRIASGDAKPTDDRGHLIGDQFDGINRLENLVPMDAELNRGDFVRLENKLADAVKSGDQVYFKVEPVYNDGGKRPSSFMATYRINGEESWEFFENGGKNAAQ